METNKDRHSLHVKGTATNQTKRLLRLLTNTLVGQDLEPIERSPREEVVRALMVRVLASDFL